MENGKSREDMKIQAESTRNHHHVRAKIHFLWIVVGALIGYILGRTGTSCRFSADERSTTVHQLNTVGKQEFVSDRNGYTESFISHQSELPLQRTPHVGVNKQVLLAPFRVADNFAGVSIARVESGQTIELHHHPTMFEFFYILSGEGYVSIIEKPKQAKPSHGIRQSDEKGAKSPLVQGSFLLTAPGDYHSFGVEKDKTAPMQMIYFGVTTDSVQ